MSGGFSQSTPGGNVVNGAMIVSVTGSKIDTNGVQYVNVVSGTLLMSGSVATSNGALESTQLKGLPIFPLYNTNAFRFLCTGSQSNHISFLTAPNAGLITAISASKVFTLESDPYTPVYFMFDLAASGHAISSTDTFSTGRCDMLQAGERRDGIIPIGTSGLLLSASVTSSISLSVSS
jgi:hypothetical protein